MLAVCSDLGSHVAQQPVDFRVLSIVVLNKDVGLILEENIIVEIEDPGVNSIGVILRLEDITALSDGSVEVERV